MTEVLQNELSFFDFEGGALVFLAFDELNNPVLLRLILDEAAGGGIEIENVDDAEMYPDVAEFTEDVSYAVYEVLASNVDMLRGVGLLGGYLLFEDTDHMFCVFGNLLEDLANTKKCRLKYSLSGGSMIDFEG